RVPRALRVRPGTGRLPRAVRPGGRGPGRRHRAPDRSAVHRPARRRPAVRAAAGGRQRCGGDVPEPGRAPPTGRAGRGRLLDGAAGLARRQRPPPLGAWLRRRAGPGAAPPRRTAGGLTVAGRAGAGDVRAHVVASGRVQGVWYRQGCWEAADAAGVRGWVRNRPDGTVEAVLEGT